MKFLKVWIKIRSLKSCIMCMRLPRGEGGDEEDIQIRSKIGRCILKFNLFQLAKEDLEKFGSPNVLIVSRVKQYNFHIKNSTERYCNDSESQYTNGGRS